MRITLLLLICLLSTHATFGQHVISESDFSIGKAVRLQSAVLKEERTLNIYLPLSYATDSLKQYPIIYLLDGSQDEDFIHIAGLVQFGSFPWINMLPESIVVGIGNVDRKRDYTYPSQSALDREEFPTSGKSAAFMTFMEKELKPYITSTYRTTGRSTIIGQSLGGLLATEVLYKKPELFDNYIIVSPSLWWDDERLLTADPVTAIANKQIYIAGGKEGEVMERTAKALYEKLRTSIADDSQVYYEFLEDKTHGDALHMAVYHAFEEMYKSKGD